VSGLRAATWFLSSLGVGDVLVIDPINPDVETPDQVCDRILLAAKYLPISQLGATDDCGFAPFADDTSTSRDIAFEKISVAALDTKLAPKGD
jgi:5-methyltetrahydropteroyltriglutamate--homocysteine methyltransferase